LSFFFVVGEIHVSIQLVGIDVLHWSVHLVVFGVGAVGLGLGFSLSLFFRFTFKAHLTFNGAKEAWFFLHVV
jgi:hypothetical protein